MHIKTNRIKRVIVQLPQFTALRTLSLECVGMNQPLRMALDVTSVTTLEDLAIENFSVDFIAGPPRCKLHACFAKLIDGVADFGRGCIDVEPWIFSNMRSSKNIPLSSFSLHNLGGLSEESWEALGNVLNTGWPLDYLYLDMNALSEELGPLDISEHRWQGLLTAKKLRISGYRARVLRADGACPSWERLSLESADDAGLSVQSMSSMSARLRAEIGGEFTFPGSVRAPLAFQLGAEMARMGRACRLRAHEPCGGDS